MPNPTPVRLADINIESYIFFGAGAAVAWQLAYPGVGRGVARHSQTLRRPFSRLRATMSYIYAVSLGTDEDRATIARHVNRAHVPVQGEDYSAFDRDLQLWVAATLYRGGLEMYELFVGPVPESSREPLYQEAWAFGRTLQVADEQWPPTADAFDAWWESRQLELRVDEEVRAYLHAVLEKGAPWYLRPALPLQAGDVATAPETDVRIAMGAGRREALAALSSLGTASVLAAAALASASAGAVLPAKAQAAWEMSES